VQLIDADMWIWSITGLNHDRPGDVITTCALDGGWKSSDEKTRVYEILSSPDFNTRGLQSVFRSMANGERLTVTNDEVLPLEVRDELMGIWRSTGFEWFLLSLHPISPNFSSNLGVHRRCGKPPFGVRERSIVHAVFQQIGWLHYYGANEPARKPAARLAKREREALIMLLSGYSTPEIARRMKITSHTVKDYVRRVHRRFRVSSRAELQAYFFQGTNIEFSADDAPTEQSATAITQAR
jgi:DNA-binding CsgD family transcriptional regulator